MLFSSPVFLFAFLPIVILVYYGLLRGYRRGQNLFLLLASLFFYGWADWGYMLVMVGSILGNWAFGLWAGVWRKAGKKTACPVLAAVACNLLVFYVFKYRAFVLANLRGLGVEVPVVSAAIPVGISFFTFQALSYVMDVARGEGEMQKNPLYVGLYISFFPQLIAGPIVKYRAVSQQIMNRRESWEKFSQGCCRFLIGLGKKVILSNQLAIVADAAFVPGGPDSVSMAWLGAVCYTLQIYFDFGGYSDMAIGLGKMFGFQLPENFRYPYLAHSFRDFWRRWHISLSAWFRDYVYIPLGGSRVDKKWKLYRNLFVVWLLTGIWHGANWTFLCWGLLWFALLTLERLWPVMEGRPLWAKRTVTFLAVTLTWVVFRADSLPAAGRYFLTMFKLGRPEVWSAQTGYFLRQNWFVLALSALCCAPTATWLRGRLARLAEKNRLSYLMPAWDGVCALATVMLFLISASFLAKGTYNPFIYFNF